MLGFLMVVLWAFLSLPPIFFAVRKWKNANTDDEEMAAFRFTRNTALWIVSVILCLWGVAWLFNVQVSLWWYEDVGYTGRFWTELSTRTMLFWGAFAIVFMFFMLNVEVVRKLTKRIYEVKENPPFVLGVGAVIAAIIGWLIGLHAKTQWFTVLKHVHGQPFGKTDPVFGKDIGFYVFTLPYLDALKLFFYLSIRATMLCCVIYYLVIGVHAAYNYKYELKNRILNLGISHVSALGIVLLGNLAFGTFLARYKVLYSSHGNVFGAGWTDLNVKIPAYWMFMAILGICAFYLLRSVFASSHKHTLKHSLWGFGLAAGAWVVGLVIIPLVAQRAKVTPNELKVERPYIERELKYTRAAYNLEKVKKMDFPVKDGIVPQNIKADAETLESARLWDWRVLIATNHQRQAFKSYYTFSDVDVVPYNIGGIRRQIMYSAREMDVDKLPDSAKTWQNQHLFYTHGIGGTANPVNTFVGGQPDYWLSNMPPVAKYPELRLEEPRIYFGEETTNHVYLNTKTKEFDYPVGNGNTTYRYGGKAGIKLGDSSRRLAIAWVFDGPFLTWSDEITSESRLLFCRDIACRTESLLEGMYHENDVYQVISGGHLWFFRDFETVTDMYPYSKPNGEINYIRNSVKAVVNAYTGETNFYIADPSDPIVRTYQRIFPGLLKPMADMPPALRQYVRYPEGMFQIQGAMYANYHMNDATSFYNKEDVWQVAEQYSPSITEPSEVEPYYMVMALPGQHVREYMLVLPFTPFSSANQADEGKKAGQRRDNLVGWLGARCDAPNYGELVVYRFPTTRQIMGPLQVGIKMNQHPEMSKDFTLWNQQGSKVILGGMRVLPLSDNRLLYVQSVFLQSQNANMPELKYVVVGSGNDMLYDTSFQKALQRLAGTIAADPPTSASSPAVLTTGEVPADILAGLDRYVALTKQGRFAEAGQELQALIDRRAKMKGK